MDEVKEDKYNSLEKRVKDLEGRCFILGIAAAAANFGLVFHLIGG